VPGASKYLDSLHVQRKVYVKLTRHISHPHYALSLVYPDWHARHQWPHIPYQILLAVYHFTTRQPKHNPLGV
jgi:hypothetical protein